MKKLIVCLGVCLMTAFMPMHVKADNGNVSLVNEARVEAYISATYRQIDFGKNDHLSYEVFRKAMLGYMNLLNAGKLNGNKQVLTVCDFSKSSNDKRMWIIDLMNKRVLFNTYVAHGMGSGDEYAESFSNLPETHKSSLGFYVTGNTYEGEHGLSLRLNGMDHGFNDAALDRGIVVHGANYVCPNFIAGNDRLGRSWGCPAIPMAMVNPVINLIKDGTCLFIFYPEKNYLQSAYWVNKKVDNLPGNNMLNDLQLKLPNTAAVAPLPSDDVVIQYISNGKVDSSVTVPRASLHLPAKNSL